LGVKRVVNTEFWQDDKVEGMTPEEKYFWLYLLTNPYTKQLGIYKITKKQMAFQLGYDIETVTKLLERFEDAYGLIKYIDGEVAIKNFLRHSILKGGKPVEDCLNADIRNVKHRSLVRWVFDGLDPSKVNGTVLSVIESWKESNKESINDNDIHNDNDNDSIVATIRPRYVHDSLFEQTLKDFEEMRKKIKKPMTERAKIALVERLEELAPNDTYKQIKIMEQSILNCWQGVYEIKEEDDLKRRTQEAYIKDVELKLKKEERKDEPLFK